PAAEVARHAAHDDSGGHRDEHRERSDAERNARPIDEPAPHVPPERVGAERVLLRWRVVGEPGDVDLEVRPVGCDERRGERHGHEEGEHEQRRGGGRVSEEAPTRGTSRRSTPDLGDQDQGQYGCAADREPVPDGHDARTRMRGSATPYSASARRLPSTTITLATSAAAVTMG